MAADLWRSSGVRPHPMHIDAANGHAARDWEAASAEQLEKEVSLIALDVLRIASRSASNRAQLLRLGILPSLTRLMKVTQACSLSLSDRDCHGAEQAWLL